MVKLNTSPQLVVKYVPTVKFSQYVHGRLSRYTLTITLSHALLPAAASDRTKQRRVRGGRSC